MRRSLRDAIVGLSIVSGIVGFGAAMLWLQGIKLGSNNWKITASFNDATGLAERAPVTYRGILVGSVVKINVTRQSVEANLEISQNDLILPKPVFAKVINSSLLGGDVQVALISKGNPNISTLLTPSSDNCPSEKILCAGDMIQGQALMNISTLTEEFEKILEKADKQNVVSSLVDSTEQFDKTQKNLDELIVQVKEEIARAEPIITNLKYATMHINNILASLDNPDTINDLKKTAQSTRSITEKFDELSGDVVKIMDDPELMSAVKNVTIGLAELFNELYPARLKDKN